MVVVACSPDPTIFNVTGSRMILYFRPKRFCGSISYASSFCIDFGMLASSCGSSGFSDEVIGTTIVEISGVGGGCDGEKVGGGGGEQAVRNAKCRMQNEKWRRRISFCIL